jgi:hypothetical protein
MVCLIDKNRLQYLDRIKEENMENKIIIIYQSGKKNGNTKYIAEQIAKQLNF